MRGRCWRTATCARSSGRRAIPIRRACCNRSPGSTTTGGFCGKNNTYTLYFALRFDTTPTAHGTWDEKATTAGSDAVDSPRAGGWFTFPAGSSVRAEVGLSYVSTDAALANLEDELPGAFDVPVSAQLPCEPFRVMPAGNVPDVTASE